LPHAENRPLKPSTIRPSAPVYSTYSNRTPCNGTYRVIIRGVQIPATTFYTVSPSTSRIITTVTFLTFKNVCQSHASSRKLDSSEGRRSLQTCGSSVRNWLHVTFLVPKIWRWPLTWISENLWTSAFNLVFICRSLLD
jgi:hypothetical protein